MICFILLILFVLVMKWIHCMWAAGENVKTSAMQYHCEMMRIHRQVDWILLRSNKSLVQGMFRDVADANRWLSENGIEERIEE